jgi:hypothetical protein
MSMYSNYSLNNAGGDPITSGVRYIIAAFLYAEDSDVQCDCVRKHQLDTATDTTADACKKLRTAAEPLQWQQSDAAATPFAFAFDDNDTSQ